MFCFVYLFNCTAPNRAIRSCRAMHAVIACIVLCCIGPPNGGVSIIIVRKTTGNTQQRAFFVGVRGCVCQLLVAEQLFDRKVDFAAAPDVFPPDRFNAGVMVVAPSEDVLQDMLSKASELTSYDGGDTGDQNSI